MIKSKYQQCFHCFIACIIVPYTFWFSYQQNIVTILISPAFRSAALIRGEALLRGRHLFQCGYSKVGRLLEGGAYLRPGAYYRKYGMCIVIICCPVCDVINFEFNHSFLIKPFFEMTKKSARKCKYLKNKKRFQPGIKSFYSRF